ncbi:VOC family protein [Aerococcus viridans]|uniref:VOC family protein n=1 Tax=Aerococcus viridans TaxID=1377 RepID=UPI003AA910C0
MVNCIRISGVCSVNLIVATCTLNSQLYISLSGGPYYHFQFNEVISLTIYCNNQGEIDYY